MHTLTVLNHSKSESHCQCKLFNPSWSHYGCLIIDALQLKPLVLAQSKSLRNQGMCCPVLCALLGSMGTGKESGDVKLYLSILPASTVEGMS